MKTSEELASEWGVSVAAVEFACEGGYDLPTTEIVAQAFDAGANFASELLAPPTITAHELWWKDSQSFHFTAACSCGTFTSNSHIRQADARKEWEMHVISAATDHRRPKPDKEHVHPETMPCNVMCPAHPNTVKGT